MTAPRLDGTLRLRPGREPPHGIVNGRALALARVCVGLDAAQVPALMPRLYALCGGAHELAARLALEAAAGQARVDASAAQRRQLQAQTLREHLRRLWLNWPQPLAGQPPRPQALAALRELWQGDSGHAARAAAWVAAHALGMAPEAWLGRLQAEPGWLDAWIADAPQEPAWLLREAARLPLPEVPAMPAVEDVLGLPGALAGLGARLLDEPGFMVRPVLPDGRCAQTGAAPRLQRASGRPRPASVVARLAAGVEEVARLAAGEDLLRAWAEPLGGQAAVAAVEMARGVLLHAVRLDAAQRVAGYHVVAPTEWNFHPEGGVARALARLRGDEAGIARLAGALATAFDPCVAFEVAARTGPARRDTIHDEIHHA
ncbi:hypothetical protein [Caldimonas thermodepolymerans]|uniref:hypothetical protein n=1 Tax=Caldimonas thermodepolymerans TaxID=215580 RepID=UPI00249083BF|nr:hypothetical protein [Caldimonas thermodepolymerans]